MMQWLDRTSCWALLVVLLLSLGLLGGGYGYWVVPMQRQVVWLHRRQLVASPSVKKPVVVFDEQAELVRWSGERGGLLLWQRKERTVSFRWLGTYTAMIAILQHWPDELGVVQMHWQRGKTGGVQWSGKYALAD